jgi:hypothetical protein
MYLQQFGFIFCVTIKTSGQQVYWPTIRDEHGILKKFSGKYPFRALSIGQRDAGATK